LFMWQPNRKPIEVKKHSSCSEGMWSTTSCTGAQYLQGVAQGRRGRSSEACVRRTVTGACAAASYTEWRVVRWQHMRACVRACARVRVQERRT
jgi:hypothetical protein